MPALKYNIKLVTLLPTASIKHRADILDLIYQHMARLELALAKAEIKSTWGYTPFKDKLTRFGTEVEVEEVNKLLEAETQYKKIEDDNGENYTDEDWHQQYNLVYKLFDEL